MMPSKFSFQKKVALASAFTLISPDISIALDEEYLSVKRVVQEMVASGSLSQGDLRIYPPEWRGSPDAVFLYGCWADVYSARGPNISNYFHIALQTVMTQIILEEEGYSSEIWRPLVSNFEERAVAASSSANADALIEMAAEMTESLSDALGPSPLTGRLIDVGAGGDCGDGGVWVQLVSDPTGGTIYLMNEFDFRLCQLDGYDPWDFPDSCRWDQVATEYSLVSGNYRFVIKWADGKQSTGAHRILSELPWDQVVVTLR